MLYSTSDTNRTHLSAMSRPSSPAGLSAPGHEGQDPPHPHHLAEQLPPINFEPASSEHTVAESAGEPMGAASEKGGATSDGGIEADAAGATAGDAEKGVASGPAVSDFPDGGFRAWRYVLLFAAHLHLRAGPPASARKARMHADVER